MHYSNIKCQTQDDRGKAMILITYGFCTAMMKGKDFIKQLAHHLPAAKME